MSSSVNKVRLTKFQREEARYLLDIMEEGFNSNGDVEEETIAKAYGFDRIEELTDLQRKMKFKQKAGSVEVELNIREAQTIWGEFENRLDIELDNSDGPGDEHMRAYAKYKDGMARLENVFGQEVKA